MKLRINDILAVDDLPSLPEVAHRVLTLARDNDTDVSDLAEAVKADPAMSAKVLRTANSALFGRQYKVNSVHAAIPVLGGTLLRTLVLGFSLTNKEKWQRLEVAYRSIWRRAVTQAAAAERLAKRISGEDPAFYFLCGLVQDVGALAILGANSKEYADEVLLKCNSQSLAKFEKQLFGYSHVDVSVGLCEKWQLDAVAIAAVREHHQPLRFFRKNQSTSGATLSEALKLASRCAHYVESDSNQFAREFHDSMSRVFDLDPNDTDEFFDELKTRVNELTADFTCGIDGLPPIEEIMGKAKTAIEEVAIRSQLEVSQTIHHTRRLEEQASQDPLTGARNRRALESELGVMIQQCIEGGRSLGILFIDIDNFKPHNDMFGHDAGDAALKTFVKILKGVLRNDDLIVRYGGDEFIAICVGPSCHDLNSIAERICKEFEAKFSDGTTGYSLTSSIGGIHCPSELLGQFDLGTMIGAADEKMYDAKHRGGNQWSIESLDLRHPSTKENSQSNRVSHPCKSR